MAGLSGDPLFSQPSFPAHAGNPSSLHAPWLRWIPRTSRGMTGEGAEDDGVWGEAGDRRERAVGKASYGGPLCLRPVPIPLPPPSYPSQSALPPPASWPGLTRPPRGMWGRLDPRVEPGDDGGWGEGGDGRERTGSGGERELGACGKGPLIPALPTFSPRGRRARGAIVPHAPRHGRARPRPPSLRRGWIGPRVGPEDDGGGA